MLKPRVIGALVASSPETAIGVPVPEMSIQLKIGPPGSSLSLHR
jgi:hypothetical protein